MLTNLTPIVGYRSAQYRRAYGRDISDMRRILSRLMWAIFSGSLGAFMLGFALLSLLGGI